jgi:transposase
MTLSNKTRAMVYYLSKIKGLSLRKVAKECSVSKSTVLRIKRSGINDKTSRTLGRETRGRPSKLTERIERLLERSIKVLREQEGSFSIQRLMTFSNIKQNEMSLDTVRRLMHRKGYYYLQARKKGLLTKKDMEKRLKFARKIKREYNDDLWTKEISFYLDGTAFAYKRNPLDQARAPKGRIWRKKSEGMDYACTSKGRKTGTGGRVLKLMVAISYNKGVIICKPYDKLNGPNFAKFIDENFKEMFDKANKTPQRLWIQDGDPSQNSAIARQAMRRADSELLNIPPRSPDLNPIENLFKYVSDELRNQALSRKISSESL